MGTAFSIGPLVKGEASDKVCEIVDAPVRFKPDAWKRFGLPVS